MLKARKKITRKEIQQDPFLESLYSIKTYFEQNRKKIIQTFTIVLVVVVGLLFLNNRRLSQNVKAETYLGKALLNLTNGDEENGLLQLELLADDYSGTKSAQEAMYYLGRIFYEKKDYLSAKSYINDFLDDPSDEFEASALVILAELEKNIGNIEAAITNYRKAIKSAFTDLEKNKFTILLIKLYLQTGQYHKAKQLVEDMKGLNDISLNIQNEVDEISGRLERAISDEQ